MPHPGALRVTTKSCVAHEELRMSLAAMFGRVISSQVFLLPTVIAGHNSLGTVWYVVFGNGRW